MNNNSYDNQNPNVQPQPVNNQMNYSNPNVAQQSVNNAQQTNLQQPMNYQNVNSQPVQPVNNQMNYSNPNVAQQSVNNVQQTNLQQPMNYQNVNTQPVQPQPAPTINNQPTYTVLGSSSNNAPANTSKKGFNKNLIIIVLIAVLAIAGVVYFFLFAKPKEQEKKEKDTSYLADFYDTEKPILVEQSEKSFFITHDGKNLTNVVYDYAQEFEDGFAVVGNIVENEKYKKYNYQIIDTKGKIKKDNIISRPKYFAKYKLWEISGQIYNDKFELVYNDDKYYDAIDGGYFTFEDIENKKSGIIDPEGKVVFSWNKDYIYADVYDMEDVKVDYNDLYMVIDDFEDNYHIISMQTGKIIYSAPSGSDYSISERDANLFSIKSNENNIKKWIYIRNEKIMYEDDKAFYAETIDNESGILELSYMDDKGSLIYPYTYYDVKNKKKLNPEDVQIMIANKTNASNEKIYGYKVEEIDYERCLTKADGTTLNCEYYDYDYLDSELYNYIKKQYKKEYFILTDYNALTLYDARSNQEIVSFDSSLYYSNETPFLQIRYYNDEYKITEYEIYNLFTGKRKTFAAEDEIDHYGSNYIIIETDDSYEYYNSDLENIYTSAK